MICIVKLRSPMPGSNAFTQPATALIDGWIIATDVHDARRQAQGAGETELAAALYRQEWIAPGKHHITPLHVALVT